MGLHDDMLIVLPEKFAKRNPDRVVTLSLHQLIYSVTGLVLGLVCIIGGIVLYLAGTYGATNWTARVLGLESTITDAAPGAVLAIVGLFVVMITRYVLKIQK